MCHVGLSVHYTLSILDPEGLLETSDHYALRSIRPKYLHLRLVPGVLGARDMRFVVRVVLPDWYDEGHPHLVSDPESLRRPGFSGFFLFAEPGIRTT